MKERDYQEDGFLEEFARENGFWKVMKVSAKLDVNVEKCFGELLEEIVRRGLVEGVREKKSGVWAEGEGEKREKKVKLSLKGEREAKEEQKKKKKSSCF